MGLMLQLTDRVVDLDTGEVPGYGTLRPTERALLAWLAEHPDQTFSLHELHSVVWGYAPSVSSRAAYSCVNRIRAVIEPDPSAPVHLLAQRGEGYRLERVTLLDARTSPPLYTNAQPSLDRFVGREAELATLADRGARVLTVVGPGGAGKSRLLREAALRCRLPGGAWVVELAQVSSQAELVEAVSRALPGRAREAPAERLAALGPCWLLLDNAEHITELVAGHVIASAASAPDCRFLTASRQRLGVPGETALELGALPEEQGSELLLDRIRLRSAAVARALSADDLRALLTAADGLPLALEIVAANAALIGPDEVLRALRSGAALRLRGAEARHTTLDAVVGGSWERLAEPLRLAMATLAVIEGRFSASLAEAALSASAPEILADLVDLSLLAVEYRAHVGARWRMLVPVQAFVRRHHPLSADEVLDRLAAQIEARWEEKSARDAVPCLQRSHTPLGLELAGLRQLAAWAARVALPPHRRKLLMAALGFEAIALSARSLASAWLEEVLGLEPELWLETDVRGAYGWLCLWRGEPEEAERQWRMAIDCGLRARRPGYAAHAWFTIGTILSSPHRQEQSLEAAKALRQLARELPSEAARASEGGAHVVDGLRAEHLGQYDLADAASAAAIEAFRAAGGTLEVGRELGHRGVIRMVAEDHLDALPWFEQSIALLEQVPDPVLRALPLGDMHHAMGTSLRMLGRLEEALRHARRAVELLRDCPSVDRFQEALLEEAYALAATDRTQEAVERFDAALRYPASHPGWEHRKAYARIERTLLASGIEAALGQARQSAEGDPDGDRWMRTREAQLRFALGDLVGAAALLPATFPPDREPPSSPLLFRAEVMLRLGRPHDALDSLDELRRHHVGAWPAAYARALRGLVAALAGDEAAARSHLDDPYGTTELSGGWIALAQEWTHHVLTGARPRAERVPFNSIEVELGRARQEAEGPTPAWLAACQQALRGLPRHG